MWLLINEVKRHTWTLTLKTKFYFDSVRLKKSKQNNLMRLQVISGHHTVCRAQMCHQRAVYADGQVTMMFSKVRHRRA